MSATEKKPLTWNQRFTYNRVCHIQELCVGNLQRYIDEHPDFLTPDGDRPTPSNWVTVDKLSRVHKINRGTLRELVRKGWLEERPSGGEGPEVRPVE